MTVFKVIKTKALKGIKCLPVCEDKRSKSKHTGIVSTA